MNLVTTSSRLSFVVRSYAKQSRIFKSESEKEKKSQREEKKICVFFLLLFFTWKFLQILKSPQWFFYFIFFVSSYTDQIKRFPTWSIWIFNKQSFFLISFLKRRWFFNRNYYLQQDPTQLGTLSLISLKTRVQEWSENVVSEIFDVKKKRKKKKCREMRSLVSRSFFLFFLFLSLLFYYIYISPVSISNNISKIKIKDRSFYGRGVSCALTTRTHHKGVYKSNTTIRIYVLFLFLSRYIGNN